MLFVADSRTPVENHSRQGQSSEITRLAGPIEKMVNLDLLQVPSLRLRHLQTTDHAV